MEVTTKILNLKDRQHQVCFENGSCLTVSSENMDYVVNNSLKPILKSDAPQPVLILRVGHCSICGVRLREYNTRRWRDERGRPREICQPCLHSMLSVFAPRQLQET